MASGPGGSGGPEAPSAIYDWLETATPAGRAEVVLNLIGEHPEGRLELPAVAGRGAMLDGVELGLTPPRPRPRRPGARPRPEAAAPALDLRGADLRGARLRRARLARVDLSKADLRDASLGGADLRGATLEGADLRGADLAGARLAGASLGGADCRGAMLEEADLRGAGMRFVKLQDATLEHARLGRADLWGALLEGAALGDADLRRAVLTEADVRTADLSRADLRGAIAGKADFRAAILAKADLRGAILMGADFRDAVLTGARLQGLDLSGCDIARVHLGGAWLDEARFQRDQLGGAIGEELAGAFDEARKGYLVLERTFAQLGDHDAANWAYLRRRRMQKRDAWQMARAAHARGRWRGALRNYARYARDVSVEWLCDYGESIPRVLASLLVLYLAFIAIYGLTGSVVREVEAPSGVLRVTTRAPADLAIFSLLAMTTGTIGVRYFPAHDLALTLVGIHVFLGVALVGLLGFVVGNRIRR